jgi:hypothetical protein
MNKLNQLLKDVTNELCEGSEIKSTESAKQNKLILFLYKKMPKNIFFFLVQTHNTLKATIKKNNYKILNKKWSSEFLNKATTINLDKFYNYFPEEDYEELSLFLKTHFYLSFENNIPKKVIETTKTINTLKKYNDYKNKIKKQGKYDQIINNNKKIIIKRKEYSLPTYYHGAGINYLTKEQKEKISKSIIIDIGAATGDTPLLFSTYTNKEIYAFEPEIDLFNKLISNTELNKKKEQIKPINLGLSNKSNKKMIKGDNFCIKNKVKPGLIKMDVEGHELEVLEGLKKIIEKEKPIILVSAYHHAEEFFTTPELLLQYNKTYNFRFVNTDYTNPFAEKIIIAY